MTVSGPSPDPSSEVMESQLSAFAASLGAASIAHLRRPDVLARAGDALRDGVSVEDAVLREVFVAAPHDTALADDFFRHLLRAAPDLAAGRGGAALQSLVETGDLVQSVCGDVWREMDDLRFDSLPRFLALVRTRLDWKASDAARRAKRQRRREDLRIESDPADLGVRDRAPTPYSRVVGAESEERLLVGLLALAPRDRKIVCLHLKGADVAAIAEQLGTGHEAARKALSRALQRLRAKF